MYHRINSKLVAVGEFDLTNKRLASKYFIYDPDYKFLSLGVVGRIHEIEYCKMLKRRFHPFLEFYILGDFSVNCEKLA